MCYEDDQLIYFNWAIQQNPSLVLLYFRLSKMIFERGRSGLI